MGAKKLEMTPISDETAVRIAEIIGIHSAMAQALGEAIRRREAGEAVGLFLSGSTILVGPYPEGTALDPALPSLQPEARG